MSSLSRPLTYLQNVNVDNVLAEKRIGEAIFAIMGHPSLKKDMIMADGSVLRYCVENNAR